MALDLQREDIPKITRVGGSGRQAEPWEDHLAPVRDTPGVSYRAWTYATRNGALSRVATVKGRLDKVAPDENWKIVVRVVPNTDPEQFGVYVEYQGQYTPDEMAENERLHQERSERVKAARAAAAETATEPVAASAVETPQDRVRAARQRTTARAS